ncbi:unnamed protein product [Didymodactylos carnosus]|uniref:Uncharacterized protein n=1 Tax=Didymodactylos carnosus TaxID=1234261 RepID=A0A815MZK4_9BILA|nr:unnamed protein product [Didymodactylos carnosus]CAF4307976.1 unnamed protein product [Didymodactylos carnosus]
MRPVNVRIQDIIYKYKQRAVRRRGEKLAGSHGMVKRKVTEMLMKNTNNQYKSTGCGKYLKPQGITNHVLMLKAGVRSVSSRFNC